jgi:hypothetical protein
MSALNPNQIFQMAQKLGPKTAVIQLVNQQFQNNPQIQQLMGYAERGDIQTLTDFAQQYLGQQGIDLNQELNKIRK